NKIFGGAGNGSRGVSVITRSESNGMPCSAQARAMNSVSMSTAEAPDSRATLFLCLPESINAGVVNRLAVRIGKREKDRLSLRSRVEKFLAIKRSPGCS